MSVKILKFLFLILVSFSGYSQDKKINDLVQAFDEYRKENYEEKIYLHLDRPSYLTGETMWFKLYLVNTSSHNPSNLSSVAYVEILDQDLKPVLQSKLEVKAGTGSGSLYIPATIRTANYTVRAYTGWMKNYSADFYFSKEVPIINPFITAGGNQTKGNEKVDVQFFPEGGNLVEGIKSKVAFQVLDPSGKGLNCEGSIVDEKLDTVVRFATSHFGIGNFYFTPEVDKKYKAIIRHEHAKQATVELPTATPFGYVMEVSEQNGNTLAIEVRARYQSVSPTVHLFIHSRNQIVTTSTIRMNNGLAQFDVDIADLPEGISHITVFDTFMRPVCERLYFKKPILSQPKVSANQSSYLTRSNVKIDMDFGVDKMMNPFDLSVSIYKTDSIYSSTLNIQNYFLLTSDLKGTVESPEFYFQSDSTASVAADNLMLTHGWRRFKWEQVFENKIGRKDYIPETRGHIIQAIAKKNDSLAVGVVGYLSAPGKIVRIYPSRSGNDGKLYFEMLDFYGKSKIVVQKNFNEDSISTIAVVPPFSDQYADHHPHPLELSKNWVEQLEERSVAMQVEDIYQPDPLLKPPVVIDSTAFYGVPDATYLLDDFTRFPVLEEVLREYVPGVFVRKRKDGFQFLVVNKEMNATFKASPLILLDGVPIFDEDEIMDLDPRLIKRLEVVQRRWLQGPGNFFGIVSFSTYNGDLAGFSLNPNSIVLDYEGLQLQREFYAPTYEDKKQRESRLPDQRTVLYWNPSLITDELGKAQFEFYTSDLPGNYSIVVEGMNKDGELCTATTSITVKGSN